MLVEIEIQPPSSDEKFAETIVAIWSKAVDTQMHFNEMSVKSRQLGLTFVAAALGLAVFLISRSGSDARLSFPMTIHGRVITLQTAEFIILVAATAVYAVKLLDLGVYHKMLRGAVAFGEDLERQHLTKMLNLNKGMTQAISHFSRHSDAKVVLAQDKATYQGSNMKSAEKKIARFYSLVIVFLVVCAIAIFVVDNQFV